VFRSDAMIDKNKILVVIRNDKVIISYDGKNYITQMDKYKDLSKEQIKEKFIEEIEGR
jgi:hypothetical protein